MKNGVADMPEGGAQAENRKGQAGRHPEITGFKRNRIFLFRRYVDIFKDHEVVRERNKSES